MLRKLFLGLDFTLIWLKKPLHQSTLQAKEVYAGGRHGKYQPFSSQFCAKNHPSTQMVDNLYFGNPHNFFCI